MADPVHVAAETRACPAASRQHDAPSVTLPQPAGALLQSGEVPAVDAGQVAPSGPVPGSLSVEQARAAGLLPRGADRPAELDLRVPWWPVTQLAWQHGSAVAAVLGGVVRYALVRAGRLKDSEQLSLEVGQALAQQLDAEVPQVLVDPGLSLGTVLASVLRHGVVTRALHRSVLAAASPDGNAVLLARAASLRAHAVVALGRDPAEWRAWMAQVGPVLGRVDVDASWRDHRPGDPPLHGRKPRQAAAEACAMVGYRRDALLFRREYGRECADEGCLWATDTWALDNVTEAWGVLV